MLDARRATSWRSPMKDGVIADFEVTEKMLTYYQERLGAPAHRHRCALGNHAGRETPSTAPIAKASEVHLRRRRRPRSAPACPSRSRRAT